MSKLPPLVRSTCSLCRTRLRSASWLPLSSLRQAEIERVRRKRTDNLDAYDLLLRALPSVYTCMPEGAAKALPHLEQALAMEPAYALAHGFAGWAHEIIFVRGGMRRENYDGAISTGRVDQPRDFFCRPRGCRLERATANSPSDSAS